MQRLSVLLRFGLVDSPSTSSQMKIKVGIKENLSCFQQIKERSTSSSRPGRQNPGFSVDANNIWQGVEMVIPRKQRPLLSPTKPGKIIQPEMLKELFNFSKLRDALQDSSIPAAACALRWAVLPLKWPLVLSSYLRRHSNRLGRIID